MEKDQEQQLSYTEPPKTKKSRKGLYIVLVILGVLFAGGYLLNELLLRKDIMKVESREQAISNIFAVSEYDDIPEQNRGYIYDFLEYNEFLDGTYFLTKIPDRAKLVYAFGDFTNDGNGIDDMAVLFEKNDYQSSMLVIFNHRGEGLFIKHYEYELPIINSFKSGAKIFMNDTKLIPAPCGGLIIKTGEQSKYALVYDEKTKKFDSYYQYSEADLEIYENGEYLDYDEEGDEVDDMPQDSTASVNAAIVPDSTILDASDL
jgi:hypothetical protein